MIKAGTLFYSTYDEYEIISQIGQGGNGTVFKAKNGGGILYAIKTISANVQAKVIARFKNEIEFCKKYDHKNVIKIIDSGRLKNDTVDIIFCVMPLYDQIGRAHV